MPVNTRALREGIAAGLLGATGVALWILGVDVVAGRALQTPAALGGVLVRVLGRADDMSPLANAALYTPVHVAAFLVIGIVASYLVDGSRRVPQMAVGLFLLFVVFEVGFYFVAFGLSQYNIMGTLAWFQVGVANLVGAGLMGTFLWRRHPEFARGAKLALGDQI